MVVWNFLGGEQLSRGRSLLYPSTPTPLGYGLETRFIYSLCTYKAGRVQWEECSEIDEVSVDAVWEKGFWKRRGREDEGHSAS